MKRGLEIIGDISQIEVIAAGSSIHRLRELRQRFGGRRWRKMKGVARVWLSDDTIRLAELHWYEAHGVGRKGMKIKRVLDE